MTKCKCPVDTCSIPARRNRHHNVTSPISRTLICELIVNCLYLLHTCVQQMAHFSLLVEGLLFLLLEKQKKGMYYKRSKGKLLIHKLAEILQWFRWTHHSEGKTHCEECLKLDGCWFPNGKIPQWPHHPFCHCTLDPIDYLIVLMNAVA